MTRSELIEVVKKENPHLSVREVDRLVRAIFEKMVDTLAEGGRIELRGFGSFTTRMRSARQGRNPKNGAPVEVEEKSTIYFRAGKPLLQRLNAQKSKA